MHIDQLGDQNYKQRAYQLRFWTSSEYLVKIQLKWIILPISPGPI